LLVKDQPLAMTSLAVYDHDVCTFFFNSFKDVVYQLCATQSFKFVTTPMSTGCTKNVVLADINYKLDFFEEFEIMVSYIVVKTL
jgi:hypothetical protein